MSKKKKSGKKDKSGFWKAFMGQWTVAYDHWMELDKTISNMDRIKEKQKEVDRIYKKYGII